MLVIPLEGGFKQMLANKYGLGFVCFNSVTGFSVPSSSLKTTFSRDYKSAVPGNKLSSIQNPGNKIRHAVVIKK